MEYPMNIYQMQFDNGQKEWCVEFIDLPGCVGGGDTVEDAIADAQATKEVYLQCLKEEGAIIPKASDLADLPSGKIALRVPRSTHKALLYKAHIEGVSLNAYINTAISEKLGRDSALDTIWNRIKAYLNVFTHRIGSFNGSQTIEYQAETVVRPSNIPSNGFVA